MSNKAHTATLNRIRLRYGVSSGNNSVHDIKTSDFVIEVETSASIPTAVERLKEVSGPVYIAVTNKEGVKFANKHVEGTSIGVMDPKGNVVRASGDHEFASDFGGP